MATTLPTLSGRELLYPNEILNNTDLLGTETLSFIQIWQLSESVLGFGIGNTRLVRGLPCTPVVPPGLQVVVGVGSIYSFEFLDSSDFGGSTGISADTNVNHKQYKQGLLTDPVTLNTPAPINPGNSVIHLVQGTFLTIDQFNVSRSYYNSATPTTPIVIANNSYRTDNCIVGIKLGTESVSPVPPTPDSGYTALYYVQVTYGQTTITSGNITVVPNAPFITEGLTQKISKATADATYATVGQIQYGNTTFNNDVGTVNNAQVNPIPAYLTDNGAHFSAYCEITNTGDANLTLNSTPTHQVRAYDAFRATTGGIRPLAPGEYGIGNIHNFWHLGPAGSGEWLLQNPALPSYYGASVGFDTTTAQQIAFGLTETLLFDHVYHDAYGWYDRITGKYTFKKIGWYSIDFWVQSTGASSSVQEAFIFLTGNPWNSGAMSTASDVQPSNINVITLSSPANRPIYINADPSTPATAEIRWHNTSLALNANFGAIGTTANGRQTSLFSVNYLGVNTA
jgi:hypothetical protein